MTAVIFYALVLVNSTDLAVVDVYPTPANCETMATRVRDSVTDPRIDIVCWPTDQPSISGAETQLRHLRTIMSPLKRT
jgi:hypothetical protein